MYAHIYTHTQKHIPMHAFTHMDAYKYMHMHTYMNTYTCMYTNTYIHRHVYILPFRYAAYFSPPQLITAPETQQVLRNCEMHGKEK